MILSKSRSDYKGTPYYSAPYSEKSVALKLLDGWANIQDTAHQYPKIPS
jgi:hypothetical protein